MEIQDSDYIDFDPIGSGCLQAGDQIFTDQGWESVEDIQVGRMIERFEAKHIPYRRPKKIEGHDDV